MVITFAEREKKIKKETNSQFHNCNNLGSVTSLAYSQFSSHEKLDFYLFKKQTETPNKIVDILNETGKKKKSSTTRRMSFLLLSELANSISSFV